MDYETKPVSRHDLRKFAPEFRMMFHVPLTGPLPVMQLLDKFADVFPGSNYQIVEDSDLPPLTMALCEINDDGGYTIEIKESVYTGACGTSCGPNPGFICHEICHAFLLSKGYTPLRPIEHSGVKIPAYCSMEWQAKALCGEVMIPYEESIGMSEETLVATYHVSWAFAEYRCRMGNKTLSTPLDGDAE